MNFAIVDDEQTEIDALSGRIREYALQEKMEITIDAYHSGEELLEKYRPYAYTAVFLDIYLDGISGITTAEKLLAADHSAVILFLTSSDAHMPEAFSLHVYDYLIKPYARDRLFKVLDDICLKSARSREEPQFSFLCNGTQISLSFSDVALVRTDRRNYLEILDARGTSYLTRMTFQSAADKLTEDARFLQILRGYSSIWTRFAGSRKSSVI